VKTLLLALLAGLSWGLAPLPLRAAVVAPKPVIMIDPGHGGSDRGVKIGGLEEASYVLDLSLKLAEALKKAGYDARLTRDQDITLTPASRTAMAAAAGALALVSLHINASYNAQARGLRVFVPAPGPVDEPAAPLWEQASRLQAVASRSLGQHIAAALGEAGGKSVQTLKLALFRGLTVPAAQVELDYASNPAALVELKQASKQDELAAKLAQGIDQFAQEAAHAPAQR
jgi:N-acetylmuramoyl-L-alanine amidase